MKIYVSGATGRIGSSFMKAFPSAIALVRKKSGFRKEIITDFSRPELCKILSDADAVVHLAGSVKTYSEDELYEANTILTEKVVECTPEKSKFIFSSSISVYGKKLKKIPADEKTECSPDSSYSRSKKLAEDAVRKKKKYVILRIGTVYGPGFRDYFRVLRLLEKGRMPLIGDGKNRIPFVYVDDVADALVSAVKSGKGTYNITGKEKTQAEVYSIACSQLGVSEPKISIPFMAATAVVSAYEFFAGVSGGKPFITREHIEILGRDRAFDCSKAGKELGFKPIPVEKGISETVMEFKKHYKV